MIYGSIDSEDTFRPLLWNETFTLAINKIKAMSEQTPLGIERIIGDQCFINVHSYDTKSESECLFEGHRNTIDMQYIISGGEYIDWALKEDLRENGNYDENKDFQFFDLPDKKTKSRIHLTNRLLAVFFPNDAHRPQISDGINGKVFKAVVKINVDLIN